MYKRVVDFELKVNHAVKRVSVQIVRNAIALSALVIVRYLRSVIPQLNRVLFVFMRGIYYFWWDFLQKLAVY